jgi:hypothetical protein
LHNVASGIKNPVTRFVGKVAAGALEMQGADIALGTLDEFLPEALQTKTGYGQIGHILRSEGDESLKKALTDVVVLSAFAAISGNRHEAKPLMERVKATLDQAKEAGLPANEAAVVLNTFLEGEKKGGLWQDRQRAARATPTPGEPPDATQALVQQLVGKPAQEPPKTAPPSPEAQPAAQESALPEGVVQGPQGPLPKDVAEKMGIGPEKGPTPAPEGENPREAANRLESDFRESQKRLAKQGLSAPEINKRLKDQAKELGLARDEAFKWEAAQPKPEPSSREQAVQPIREAFEAAFGEGGTNKARLKTTVGDRELSAVMLPAENGPIAHLEFGYKGTAGEKPADLAKAGPKAGSLEFARKLDAFVRDLGERGVRVSYDTDPKRAATYERVLKRAGFEPDTAATESGENPYPTWKKAAEKSPDAPVEKPAEAPPIKSEPTPAEAQPKPARLDELELAHRTGKRIDPKEVFDAAGLDERERRILAEMATGSTQEEVAQRVGLNSKQRVGQIAGDIAEKLGMDRSVSDAMLEAVRQEAGPEFPEGRGQRRGRTGRAMSPEMQAQRGPISPDELAASKRGLAPKTPAEIGQRKINKLTKQYLKESKAGTLTPQREEWYKNELSAISEGVARRTGQGEREPVEPAPIRREPAPGVPSGNEAPGVPAPEQVVQGPAGARGEGEPSPSGVSEAPGDELAPVRELASSVLKEGNVWHRDRLRGVLGEFFNEDQIAEMTSQKPGKPGKAAPKESGRSLVGEPAQHRADQWDHDLRTEIIRLIAPKEFSDVLQAAKATGLSRDAAEALLARANAEAETASRREVEGGQAIPEGVGGPAGADVPVAGVPFRAAGAGGAGVSQPLPGFERGPAGLDPASGRFFQDFLRGESGALNPQEVWDKFQGYVRYTVDALNRIGSESFPTIHRFSRVAGEKVMNMAVSHDYARRGGEYFADRVLGPDASPAFEKIAGGTLMEMRFRFAKDAHLRRSQEASQDAAKARAAGDMASAARFAQEATDHLKARNDITGIVGKPESPFATEADYQAALKDPKVVEALQRYKTEYAIEKENIFRDSQGLDATDPINAFTQIQGLPVRAIPLERASTDIKGEGQGNLKNVKLRKNPTSYAAGLDGENYVTNLRDIIMQDMADSYPLAAKAVAYRTLEAEGHGQWARPGQQIEGMKEVPFTTPPKGTQKAEKGDVFYISEPLYKEFRRALKVDQTADWVKALAAVNYVPTVASLASSVEAVSHGINLGGSLLAPGMRLGEVIHNTTERLWNTPAMQKKLLDLAKMGAVKPEGPESGLLTPKWLQEAVGEKVGKTLLKYDPTRILGTWLDGFSDVMRASLGDAFDRLATKLHVPDTEAAKRDFINSWTGQYEKSAQNGLVAFLRESKIGPFATAASQMTARGVRNLFGDPGVHTTSAASEVQLRAGQLAKFAAVAAIPFVANYLMWGNPLGDENTRIGALKISEENGRTKSFDFLQLAGVRRGLTAIGLMPILDSARRGESVGKAEDASVMAVVRALTHPAHGPGVSFLETAATGENYFGKKIAATAGEGESQRLENVKAALKTANPAISAYLGADAPDREVPANEKWAKAAGGFGFKYSGPSKPPEVNRLYEALHAVDAKYQEERKAKARVGEKLKEPWELRALHDRATRIGKLERRFNHPETTASERDEIRQRQAELARSFFAARRERAAAQ